PQFLFVGAGPEVAARQLMRQPGMLGRLVVRRREAREAGNGGRIVQGIVAFGRNERRMRPQDRQMCNEWALRTCDVVDAAVNEEVRIVVRGRVGERLRNWRAIFIVGTWSAMGI